MPTKARVKNFPRLGQQIPKDQSRKLKPKVHYHYCPHCNNGFQCTNLDCKAGQWKACYDCK